MPKEALTCAGKCIRIDEPANRGIIIPTLQVVEARIRIVPVAPVAEGVVGGHIGGCLGDGCTAGVEDSNGLAPGVVLVGGHQRACTCSIPEVKGNHVPLQVLGKIVIRPGGASRVLNAKTDWAVALIVQIPQRVLLCSRGGEALLGYRQTVHNVVLGVAAVGVGFSRPLAVDIVLIAVGLAAHGGGVQLPAIAPGHGVPLAVVVAQRVAAAVIGDALPVIGCQQILPVGISVGVDVFFQNRLASAVPFLPPGQISRVVVVVIIPRRERTVTFSRLLFSAFPGCKLHWTAHWNQPDRRRCWFAGLLFL